jgi:3-oxoacyl-[acyl-carrier-protein] synthase II
VIAKPGRRVAVTGMGLITPIGSSPETVWCSVTSSRSAVSSITRFDSSAFRSRVAAEVNAFDFDPYRNGHGTSRLDRFSQFAIGAAHLALEDAALHDLTKREARPQQHQAGGFEQEPAELENRNQKPETRNLRLNAPNPDPETQSRHPENRQPNTERRTPNALQPAVYLGSALGGVAFGEEQHQRYLANGIRSVAPALALSVFAGAGATNIAMAFGLRGPAISNANSCASGAVAIGEAFHLVRGGGADVALAGGVECPLAPLTFGSFSLIKAMSKRNDDPPAACRPFDRDRDGFVMAEGAAVLVLEEWEHARRRGARIRAEVLGYASTNDAHHMTVPRPDGSEACRAMRLALSDGGVADGDVGYISAHGTGTVLGDRAEMVAIRSVFGDRMPPVSGTKPLHGHSLGATPAIEAAITILALQYAFLPGTRNLTSVDPACEGNHVLLPGRPARLDVALSNAFGFGGINACLVLAGVICD